MILGIGNDLVDIRRIERILNLYEIRFINRIFTKEEQKRCETQQNRIASYARRFAAKEACAKALGTGFAQGTRWKDLVVISLPSGKPLMTIKGRACFHVRHLLPAGYKAVLHLSITDDYPMVLAFVILEAQQSDTLEKVSV